MLNEVQFFKGNSCGPIAFPMQFLDAIIHVSVSIKMLGSQCFLLSQITEYAKFLVKGLDVHSEMLAIMHQSIPAVPIPPGNRGAFAYVVSPGGGAFTILSQPGGWALAYPGGPRAFDTTCFERWLSLSGRTKPLFKTDLSVRD